MSNVVHVHHHHHRRNGGCLTVIGQVIAVVLSWGVNHSVLWAIVHFLFGWLYVIYYMLGFGH